ncbi:hypothetical protein NSU01_02830 [Paenibacillus sp. FSL H8-0259]|uniref:hypothetical protein n=1 Tax=Paenibacillus sp. FSL H8-0259 TaxID=1920423 RepID=UPI00117E4A44
MYTDEIYLKKPERVKVLGYLFLLALTVYIVFQRRIRQHITEQNPMHGSGFAHDVQAYNRRYLPNLQVPQGRRVPYAGRHTNLDERVIGIQRFVEIIFFQYFARFMMIGAEGNNLRN